MWRTHERKNRCPPRADGVADRPAGRQAHAHRRGGGGSTAGGGAGGVHINVNGIGGQDLARMIHGRVVEGIREYKRRERLY